MLLILLLLHSVFSHTLELKLEYMDSVGYVDFSKDEPFYSKEHSICNTFYSVLLWHFLYRIQSFLCLFYFEHCIYVLQILSAPWPKVQSSSNPADPSEPTAPNNQHPDIQTPQDPAPKHSAPQNTCQSLTP